MQLVAGRPARSRRTATVLRGEQVTRSRAHLGYIALELLEAGLLVALRVAALS